MAEGQFSPDLLLTVGADLTALRQQLATIQRELGATPLNVGLNPQQTQESTRALNDQRRAVAGVQDEVVKLRREQEALARALKNDLKDLEQAYTRQRVLERQQLEQGAAERLRIQKQTGAEMARDVQQEGRSFADVERQKTRIFAQETLVRQRQLKSLLADYEAIARAQQRAGANIPTPIQQRIASVGAALGGEQQALQLGALPQSPQALAAMRNEIDALKKSITSLGVPIKEADGALSAFFGRIGRYAQIAVGLTLVYGAMRAAFAGVQEFIEVDKTLARIAATMERGADRTAVLRDAYGLMVEANQRLGTSFAESGKLILELEKSLGNNTDAIRAAFLPALTLMSIGEGNQTEILRTLIGLYKIFGDTLGDTSPQEKYLRISDALIAASAASIQDIDGFRTALQNVAPAAKQSGASIEETLALLIQLTNGMQSASRAGTGLRQLFVDLQTNPQGISRVFGIEFDVDAPLNATRLLDQVIRRVRELGTTSLRSQAMLQAAFPDKRALLAFETLVELYPQYEHALNNVTSASGRTADAQRELANTVSAAVSRLSGGLLNEFILTVDKISNVKPGQASGLVQMFDTIGQSAKIVATEIRKDIDAIRELLALADQASGGATGKATEGMTFGKFAGYAYRGLVSPGALRRELLPTPYETAAEEAEKDIQRRALARANAQAQEGAANLALQPGDSTKALRDQSLLSEELARRIAVLRHEVELEAAAGNRDLEIKQRIAAADAVLIVRTKAREQAERDLLGALGVKGKELADVERVEGDVKNRLEAERRAAQEVRNLRNEDTLLQIKALKDQEDRLRERGHLFVSSQEDQSARVKIALGDEVAAFQKAQLDELTAAAQKFSKLTQEQQEAFAEEEYRVKLLEAVRKAQVAGFTESEALSASLAGQVGVLREIFRQIEAIGGIKIAPDGFQTLDAGIQSIVDKALGINKVVDANRELAATMGLLGAEAARAAVAARFGFESFEAMLELANQVRARQREGAQFTPLSSRESAALIGVPAAERTFTVTQENQIKQAEADAVKLEREQRVLRETFGQTTEEAVKQSIAIRNTGRTWEELAGSLKQTDRDYATVIAKIAEATAKGRIQAEVLGLQAAGFDELTARMIATQNEADRLEFDKLRQAGESLEEFNTRAERMRGVLGKIAEQEARRSGDPFAFFVASLQNASAQANEFWASLKALAEDTAKSMSQSLSDFFFDSFQGKLTAGKDAWKSFLGSMERALADFMSKQLVRSFLNILTGGGGEASTGVGGIGGAGAAGLLGGVASGFGSIGANYSAAGGGGAGISAALFGLPATPTTVRAGLQPSNPEIDDPTSLSQIQTMRQATSGLIGAGGNVSRDLAVAGVIAAAYTTSQSVLKLTNELSTQRDRNSATGGIAGTVIGGLAGAYFGQGAIGAGIGGLAGSYLGGLFGSDEAPAGRFAELSRTMSTVQTSLEAAVTGAKTFTDLYNVLLGFQGGGSLANATRQPVQIAVGGTSINGLNQSDFLSALRANPSALSASVQAGVSPELLGPLNQEVVQTILAKVAALDDINRQISLVIAEISAQSIAPATGVSSLDTLREQAVNFRATVDQLVAGNQAQITSLESLLQTTTDPGQILQYTTQIKGLIEDRYRTETQLVQQFAGQLDALATSFKAVSKSVEDQIFQLQLSNFGPTNPLQGYQLAQGRFDAAQTAFNASPTAENAQALQQAVDPLLKAASEVFTRPSPEYRAIFAEVVDALETVKISVDSQASDIQGALQAALGTSVSIQDLTQRNTAAMAADMRQLLAIVQAQAAAAGVGVGAGTGLLSPANNPPPGGQVTAPTQPAPDDGGSQTGALLAAVGTVGALAGPLLTIADKLGATDYLKNLFSSMLSTPSFNFNPASYSYADPGSYYDTSALYTSYTPSYTPYDYGYMAEGGPVPGSGMGDTVRAMLEPGEFVVRRDAVARNREWLEQINGSGAGVSRRGILHFQDGGMVPGTTNSNTVASAQDIAILLYLQGLLGASSADTQALLTELLRQAEASQDPSATPTTGSTSPATPSTVSGGTASATPSVVADADATVEMIRSIQALLRGGQTVAGLFSSGELGNVLGPAGSVLGIAGGALGLLAGVSSDDPFAAATGGVQLAASTLQLLSSTGVISTIPALGGYVQAVLAAIQIAQIATNGDLSDEEKAIQATKAATSAIAVALAGPTFGASLAVLQIWDFVERLRAGQDFDQAIVSANDPTALLNGLIGEDVSLSGRIFNPSEEWMNFVPELYQNAGQQGIGFSTLAAALPYVQTKEELGRLINSYKNYVQMTTGIAFTDAVNDPYRLAAIPGIGPSTHGQDTTPVDWSQPQTQLQMFIDGLLTILPGEKITSSYGADYPGGGLSLFEERLRLWDQFIPGGGSIQPALYTQLYPGLLPSLAGTSLADIYAPYYLNFGQTPISSETQTLVATVLEELQAAAAQAVIDDAARRALEDQYFREVLFSVSPGGLQSGGWVPGVSQGRDSVPAMLEPGEFVVPRAVAQANSELLMSLLGEGGGTWDGLSSVGSRVSSAARDLIGGSWDGFHRSEMGSTISSARSGDYRREGGVSSVALHIAEGAIRIDGARDPKVVSKDVLEAIEQNIRTGRLGQVIANRVKPQRTGV